MTTVIEQVNELKTSHISAIATAATSALQLYDQVINNQISNEEFEDLLNDVVNLHNIQIDMYEIETIRLITKAYHTILTLKTLASII